MRLPVSMATRNANTGISIIETADGALTEVHDMLQRMNELAVKGSTGTLTTADRKTLNEELIQLKEEVTRIAKDTEFNGQPLLDGSFDLKGYTNDPQLRAKVAYYSDDVLAKEYTINTAVSIMEIPVLAFLVAMETPAICASILRPIAYPDGLSLALFTFRPDDNLCSDAATLLSATFNALFARIADAL